MKHPIVIASFAAMLTAASLVHAEIPVKTGDKVAFLGDSTTDGVHMAFAGNVMMAQGVLKGLRLNAAELAKANNAWLDIPNTINVSSKMGLTQRQAKQLDKLAIQKKVSVDSLLDEQFVKTVEALLKSAGR